MKAVVIHATGGPEQLVVADLRISSIVDVPNWVVSFYFPRIVLE